MFTVAPPHGREDRLVNLTFSGGGTVDGQGFMHWPYVYHYRGPHGRPYNILCSRSMASTG